MADDEKNLYALNEKIIPIAIEDEMKKSYIDYSMSVIVGRALPDVRDGLKPVHRRILYAMNELGLAHNRAYRKSAKIVGDTLGNYHPHGDTAVYDTLVRMAQDFSLRYPLIDGQGNFGSVDGDRAASMRYTEARLEAISRQLLDELDQETVDFVPNYDETRTEPTVLPARFPNLLVNGSAGIAVGMATNIPPHNLTEVVNGILATIENPEITVKDLMKHIKGPDFPTAGTIMGRDGIRDAYETGRGKVLIRAKASIESGPKKEAIVITEIPYQVNKTNLIESIVMLVENKKVEGIYDIRDESDRDGMRVVIELKKDANAQVILNQLYKHTQMQQSFGIIMLSLVKGQPRVLNLKQMIEYFIEFRVEVIIKRTKFELDKAEKRAHILEGLKIAVANIDKIIKIIRGAKNPEDAKNELISQFKLSSLQAQAILELQLQRLTQLERHKIDEEYAELIKKINELKSILKSRQKVLLIIGEELRDLVKKTGDERRTQIVAAEKEIDIEDLITEEDVVITLSHAGYIKRIPVSSYRTQNRGGSGVNAAGMKDDEDFIEQLFLCSTHETILFFTNKGRVYWRKAYDIPQASRIAKGKSIANVLALSPDEKIQSFLKVREFDDKRFVVMITKNGIIKKTSLIHYSRPRTTGVQAITLRDKDELVSCMITSGDDTIFIASHEGMAIQFSEKDAREMGRTASGVMGMRLDKGDYVIAADTTHPDSTALTVTEQGFGKKTYYKEYRLQSRGGKGVINANVTDKNGKVVNVLTVTDNDELIVMTDKGMVVRSAVNQIRTTSRNTQGVRVIRLKDGHKVVSAARVVAEESAEKAAAPELDLTEKTEKSAADEKPAKEKPASKTKAEPKKSAKPEKKKNPKKK